MFGSVALLVLYCLIVALLTRKTHVIDVFDRRRGKELGTQATIEGQDVNQMLAGANAYRRKRGVPEVTPAQLQTQMDERLRGQIATDKSKERTGERTQKARQANAEPTEHA